MVDIVNTIDSIVSPNAAAENVSLISNGYIYDNWTSISVSRGMDSLCGSFSLDFVDKWKALSQPWPLKPGSIVGVKVGVTPVLTGYIDTLNAGISSSSRTLSVSGRDMTADLVDCSAVYPTGTFKNQRLEAIAAILCAPFGITVVSNLVGSTPFKTWTVKQGETVFENLSRAASQQGALLLTNELGQLYITNRAGASGVSKTSTDLIQGENIVEISATFDDSDRFGEYTVKGQSAGDDTWNGLAASQPFGKAIDSDIKRNRPLIVFADGPVDLQNAQKRANWEATIRSAKALNVDVKVRGWKEKSGQLWKPNKTVFLMAPYVGIQALMLITGVTYNKSVSDGTSSNLRLTRLDAYNPQPVVAGDPKESAGWSLNFDLLKGI